MWNRASAKVSLISTRGDVIGPIPSDLQLDNLTRLRPWLRVKIMVVTADQPID